MLSMSLGLLQVLLQLISSFLLLLLLLFCLQALTQRNRNCSTTGVTVRFDAVLLLSIFQVSFIRRQVSSLLHHIGGNIRTAA